MSDAMNDMNRQVMAEFRANGGKVGGYFDGAPMIIVHHRGAKTGTAYETPLVYRPDGDNFVIFASYAGAPANPAWFNNLMANPDTVVEVGTETVPVTATEVTGAARDEIYARQAEQMPNFAEYQAKTTRVIPVVRLTRR
jgi:deazaflavin-dependent oxidoreductase (nitroreductase family)